MEAREDTAPDPAVGCSQAPSLLPLVILAGPTAVGKTKLSIALAQAIGGEIVSADSCQVYRHMDIGSAKVTREEMQGIPHHMIDILDPWEPFNVVMFQKKCKECLACFYGRGLITILTLGTVFCIQALLRDIDFTENQEDTAYREELEALASGQQAGYLHHMLQQVDPAAAMAIHPNNIRRIIRALEYFHLTGEQISRHNAQQWEKKSAYRSCYFVLTDLRERLYGRIDRRVDQMLEKGLVEEVKALQALGCHRGLVSMQALGYKEILAFLEGELPYEEAVEVLKRNTRHFAKRQLTWFRREQDVIWVDRGAYGEDEGRILADMLEILEGKGIL